MIQTSPQEDLSSSFSFWKTPWSLTEPLKTLFESLCPLISSLGYELIFLEWTGGAGPQKTLRVSIDFPWSPQLSSDESPNQDMRIGLDDCVAVDRILDPFFETSTLISEPFHLEVSSPGADRPLMRRADLLRFVGETVKISTSRPITALEMDNETYWKTHTTQKQFQGRLLSYDPSLDRLRLEVDHQFFFIPLSAVQMGRIHTKIQKGKP